MLGNVVSEGTKRLKKWSVNSATIKSKRDFDRQVSTMPNKSFYITEEDLDNMLKVDVGMNTMSALSGIDVKVVEKINNVEMLYDQLLMAVGNKYPGESRHETALRYIQQAENIGTKAQAGVSKNELA